MADSLTVLYFAAAIGGIGTGCVYGTCVGNALKWFPGRRGIAAGITAAGFGAGAALTIIPISHMISTDGYQHAFFVFGLLQGGIVFVMSWLLLVPPPAIAKAPGRAQTAHGFTPTRSAAQPGVLCALPHVRADRRRRAHHGRVDDAARQGPQHRQDPGGPVRRERWPRCHSRCCSNRIFDGVGRPFFGWLSDQIGREYTMAIAFLIGAVACSPSASRAAIRWYSCW